MGRTPSAQLPHLSTFLPIYSSALMRIGNSRKTRLRTIYYLLQACQIFDREVGTYSNNGQSPCLHIYSLYGHCDDAFCSPISEHSPRPDSKTTRYRRIGGYVMTHKSGRSVFSGKSWIHFSSLVPHSSLTEESSNTAQEPGPLGRSIAYIA